MVSVIVATHGEFAAGLVGSAEMIFGKAEGVTAISFLPGQGPENLLAAYETATADSPDGALFLVDLFGGSPYNAAARFVAEKESMDVVSGVNLPMLIDVLAKQRQGKSVADLAAAAQQAGRDGIRSFRAVFAQQQVVDATADDEGDDL